MSFFSLKAIDIDIDLCLQDAKAAPPFKKRLQGMPCSVTITKNGAGERDTASVDIWGLGMQSMDAITTNISHDSHEFKKNQITVTAGSQGGSMFCMFIGNIAGVKADISNPPVTKLHIEAKAGEYASNVPASDLSGNGVALFDDLMRLLAAKAGFTFCNQGVKNSVVNPNVQGSLWEQIRQLAKMVNADVFLEYDVLTAIPKGEGTSVGEAAGIVTHLTPLTGMTGYPSLTSTGCTVTSLLLPWLTLRSTVKVSGSSIVKANGIWEVSSVKHTLAAHNAPGEQPGSTLDTWTTTMDLTTVVGKTVSTTDKVAETAKNGKSSKDIRI